MRSARAEFPDSVKVARFRYAGGKCEICLKTIVTIAHYDHYPVPAAIGGPGTFDNCRVLCKTHHEEITRTVDVPAIAKTKRISETRMGLRAPKRGGFRKPPPGFNVWTKTWDK
jgi:hypothetical protein